MRRTITEFLPIGRAKVTRSDRCVALLHEARYDIAMAVTDRLVGVIGGMGPDATVDFMARVMRHTPADSDQQHVRMLVDHNPRIPSRQLAMAGKGDDPGPVLASMAARLEAAGARFIVMPCNLAHAWQQPIVEATTIPFVSIVEETVAAALRSGDGEAIGLMTTPGCFRAGIYQRALAAETVISQNQAELAETMRLVECIKAGDKSPAVADALRQQAQHLVTRGATSIIAACTEFPLVLDQSMFDVPFVSSTDVLAIKTVRLALGHEPLPN